MVQEVFSGPYAQKMVKKTGVAEINFGRFDLPFLNIGVPWLKLADHK